MGITVRSARFHQASTPGQVDACPVERHLEERLDTDFALIELERPEGRFTLAIDSEWLRFAHSVGEEHPDLVDGLDLLASVLLAVVAGWRSDWDDEAILTDHDRADGVLRVDVVSRSNN